MKTALFAAIALCAPLALHAGTVSPISYSFSHAPGSGTGAYLDDTYNGLLGQLTDGVSATQDWAPTDGFGAQGPNVAWLSVDPTITFKFASAYDFSSMIVNIQNGLGAAGVSLANSFTVNGVTSPTLTPPADRGPINVTMDLSGVGTTDTLAVTLNRRSSWTFVSEFTFQTGAMTPVPVPASLPLLLAGLGFAGVMTRRKKRAV